MFFFSFFNSKFKLLTHSLHQKKASMLRNFAHYKLNPKNNNKTKRDYENIIKSKIYKS